MANARGDTTVWIGKRKVILKPSFGALMEIESLTEKGIGNLMMEFSTIQFAGRDVVSIILAGRKAAGEDIDFEQCGEDVIKLGVSSAVECCIEYLASFSDPSTDKKKETSSTRPKKKK